MSDDPLERLMKVAQVKSAEACEEVDLVLCVDATTPALFDDDVIAPCADCGRSVRHRPHAPKRPPKVCLPCGLKRIKSAE